MSEDTTKLKKEQRCDSILQSALEVMSEKGIENTTMREIAKHEGISETLLYRFYKNKFEILFAIIENKAQTTNDSLLELFETTRGMIPDPEVTLPLIWKLIKKKLNENHLLLTLMLKEQKNFNKLFFENAEIRIQLKEYMEQKGKNIQSDIDSTKKMPFQHFISDIKFKESLTDYFQRCKDAGNLRKELNPQHCAIMFLRLIWMPVLAPIPITTRLMPDSYEDEMDIFIKSQISILLHGLLPIKND
ncbi:MAG: TetR/AcrR family transcriptional regulator [Candidatus Heimdallarchaeota archaeon]|nr:TetR/AcrR family transcriptional regulator [Candidatus Heimdallarchaeota archaeon]